MKGGVGKCFNEGFSKNLIHFSILYLKSEPYFNTKISCSSIFIYSLVKLANPNNSEDTKIYELVNPINNGLPFLAHIN